MEIVPSSGADALQDADWRGGAALPVAARPSRAKPRAHDPLHLHKRAGTLAEERERAREIVAAAKEAVTTAFADIRAGRHVDAASLQPVVQSIATSIARHPAALPSVTRLKQRHEYTYLHSVAVCGLMIALAAELDLDPALAPEIGLAGLLHDIGKARVPTLLLDKPGPLALDEYALVQQHTVRGHELLRDSGIDSQIALDVCLHHHERIDGSGYPAGLSGERLSIFARMGAVCDVYDAVTSRRAYKDSWSPGEALDWMGGTSGHFDPHLLHAFRRTIGSFPIGTLVRLESQRLALVIDDPEADRLAPDVCVFLCAETRKPLPPTRIATRSDPILGVELSSRWGLADWEAHRRTMLRAFGVV